MSIGNTVRPSVGVRQRVLAWVEELSIRSLAEFLAKYSPIS
jgi:hypothetical protein